MSDKEQDLDSDLITRLSQLSAPPAPDTDTQNTIRQRVLAEYDRAAHLPTWQIGWRRATSVGGRIMSHPVSRFVAAAAVVLFAVAWLAAPRRSVAFGDFLATIVDAKTAKFKATTETDVKGQRFTADCYFEAPAKIRQEFTGPQQMTTIADFEKRRMMSLLPATKQAMIFELEGDIDNSKVRESNFFGNLRRALESYRQGDKRLQLVELGEKELDGRRVFGFRLVATGYVQTLWGEAETGKVVRIESTLNGPPKTEVVMSDFEFDVPLDDKMFVVEPPADYKVVTVPVNTAPPTEADFLESLRRLSEALDGKFPASLDTAGVAIAIAKILKGKTGETDDLTKEMMTEGVKIGRGLSFTTFLPPDNDAHYAGKGVKRDGPKTPVFWYTPSGGKTTRVVYSDLTAADVDSPPSVPGAIRMVQQFGKPKTNDEKKPDPE